MVDLTEDEKKIVEALKAFGAIAPDKLKTTDDIAKKAAMPKNIVANKIVEMTNKKILKRVAREKSAGYYVMAGF